MARRERTEADDDKGYNNNNNNSNNNNNNNSYIAIYPVKNYELAALYELTNTQYHWYVLQ